MTNRRAQQKAVGPVISKTIVLTLAGFTYLSIFVGCASTGENINTTEGEGPEHREDLTLAQSEANRTDETVNAQESEGKGKFAKGLGRIVEGPMAGAYVGTAGGNIPTMPGLIGGAAIGAVVGLVTGIQIMVTGEDPLDKDTSETLQCEPPTCDESHQIQQKLSPLIGDWKGHFGSGGWTSSITLQLTEQDAEILRGYGSISGGSISCYQSPVTLTPRSSGKYLITFAGGGCRGEVEVEAHGATLTGRIRFATQTQFARVSLAKVN